LNFWSNLNICWSQGKYIRERASVDCVVGSGIET
jgi:hypothetical protein